MKQPTARLRQLDTKFRNGDGLYGGEVQEYQNALPQLLDRMEALERVAEAAEEYFHDGAGEFNPKYFPKRTKVQDALAALEGAHSRQQAGSIPLNKKGEQND